VKPLCVSPEASRDMDVHAQAIAHFSFVGAVNFYIALEAAFSELHRRPDVGTIFMGSQCGPMRVWRVPQFRKHLIFYRETTDAVEVIRILHGAQDWHSVFQVES
jgi:toxin ParE1/3/4